MAPQKAGERLTEVGEQVPAVRYLLSLWSTLPSRLRIRARTVTTDDLHVWMDFEPARHRIGFSIRE